MSDIPGSQVMDGFTVSTSSLCLHIAVVLLHHWLKTLQAVRLAAASAASLLLWQTSLG